MGNHQGSFPVGRIIDKTPEGATDFSLLYQTGLNALVHRDERKE
ncbi:hypothetical protein Z946_1796 [Sulfitobacter noctilucicola]|nr:hypothetical protein Z946_1796 [Sulfitobacter noctilucicola]